MVIWGGARTQRQAAETAARARRARGDRLVDVSDEAAQQRGFARALERMGRLDGVIANAGFVTISPLVDMTLKQYDELQRVAQHGAFITLREGARHWSRAPGGRPRRLADRDGQPHQLRRDARDRPLRRREERRGGPDPHFALELGPHGIRANMICAGLTKTEMVPFDDAHPFGQAAVAKIPLGRMADPEEIGGIAVYLLSDAARYHTGDLITVDGGRMINGV